MVRLLAPDESVASLVQAEASQAKGLENGPSRVAARRNVQSNFIASTSLTTAYFHLQTIAVGLQTICGQQLLRILLIRVHLTHSWLIYCLLFRFCNPVIASELPLWTYRFGDTQNSRISFDVDDVNVDVALDQAEIDRNSTFDGYRVNPLVRNQMHLNSIEINCV